MPPAWAAAVVPRTPQRTVSVFVALNETTNTISLPRRRYVSTRYLCVGNYDMSASPFERLGFNSSNANLFVARRPNATKEVYLDP